MFVSEYEKDVTLWPWSHPKYADIVSPAFLRIENEQVFFQQ